MEELRAELAVDVGQDGGVQLEAFWGAAGEHVLLFLVWHFGFDGLGRLGGPAARSVQLAALVSGVVRRAAVGGWPSAPVAVASRTLGPCRGGSLLEHQRGQVALAFLANPLGAPPRTLAALLGHPARLAVREELVAARAALARHGHLLFTFGAVFRNHPVFGHVHEIPVGARRGVNESS